VAPFAGVGAGGGIGLGAVAERGLGAGRAAAVAVAVAVAREAEVGRGAARCSARGPSGASLGEPARSHMTEVSSARGVWVGRSVAVGCGPGGVAAGKAEGERHPQEQRWLTGGH
jgi:hypothetical protein